MTKYRSILFAAVCLAVVGAPFASAQMHPYSIITYQGNGQLICSGCLGWPSQLSAQFQPMVAKVVDANGVPVAGTQVTWTAGNYAVPKDPTTTTDSNGMTQTQPLVISLGGGSNASPYYPSALTASTVDNTSATFYVNQGLVIGGLQPVYASAPASQPTPPSISGSAGSQGPALQFLAYTSTGAPIQNVEIQLLNFQSSPSVSCVQGAGADPGAVLTDANGLATCTPVFAGSGTGTFLVVAGTYLPGSTNPATNLPYMFASSANVVNLSVSPPQPGSITVVSGNNQSATAGQPLPIPLVALVKDTNGNTLNGQAVTWSVSPSNYGTLTNTSTVTDANGKVQTGFTLAASASGPITITVSIPNVGVRATFTVSAGALIFPTSIQKVSGDGQTAASGQAFTNPLVVVVTNNNGAPAVGATVNFNVTGPASLNLSTPATNSAGQAQVTVTATSTTSAAQVTVTASIANLTPVTFNLTVIPPGPVVTANSFVNAADLQPGYLSPCALATVSGPGIAPNIQGTVLGASFGAAPTVLSGTSISFSGTPAPIFSLTNNNGQQSATFQVPCEITPSAAVPVVITVGGGSATVNVPVLTVSPGVYGTVGSDNVNRATLVRQDGTFVSLANPARRGETVTAFVTGLGVASPQVGTNQLPPRGTASAVIGTVIPGMSGGRADLNYARLTADLAGVYEVSFVIPQNVSPGNSVGFSVGVIPVGGGVPITCSFPVTNPVCVGYSRLIFVPVQ